MISLEPLTNVKEGYGKRFAFNDDHLFAPYKTGIAHYLKNGNEWPLQNIISTGEDSNIGYIDFDGKTVVYSLNDSLFFIDIEHINEIKSIYN